MLADTSSAERLFKLLNTFEILSGLKVNCSKTEGMWIGSKRHYKEKPFGIKWPDEPIKALGVYFTYDQKLLKEKNFIERLDSIKKLINIWSARGLSIYGKVTIIKSFLIPKYIYVCSILPTPKELLKELNKILFKFLWKGVDKVTRASVINEYEEGGLRMVDLECMVKSLRLAWLKRIFSGTNGTWKSYLQHILSSVGGLFFFNCNYNISDYTIPSQFYRELLLWWSQFRETFATEEDWKTIIWNNKEIKVENKPVYYKHYVNARVICIQVLLFSSLKSTDSYNQLSKIVCKTNILEWAGLCRSIPLSLRSYNRCPSINSLTFVMGDNIFYVTKGKSKDYYTLLAREKAKLPNIIQKLQSNSIVVESYVKAFQYRVINSIRYTNTKLYKIGFRTNDLCTFCDNQPESLTHLFYHCSRSKQFWIVEFELYWCLISNQRIRLCLENVLFGILTENACPLL